MLRFFQTRKLHSNTLWFSHHIPKTAGTSLREAYEKAIGKHSVYKLYKPAEVKLAEKGDLSMIPKRVRIVHGHFKPRESQRVPNVSIRRTVWLRDPVQRAWSLMRHIIAVQKHTNEYAILYQEFGDRLQSPDEIIFEFFLTKPELHHLNKTYRSYFSQVPLSNFDFIGITENFAEDLDRLSSIMQIPLSYQKSNVRVASTSLDNERFKPYLKEEYNVIRQYFTCK